MRPGRSRAGNLHSPGKLGLKVGSLGGAEKELAHESHLIHNSEQPISHMSKQDYESLQGVGAARGPMLTQYQNRQPYGPGGPKSHQNVPLSWQ